MRVEQIQSCPVFARGVFSSNTIPEGWLKNSGILEEAKLLTKALRFLEPDSEIVGLIPRSSNSRTILFKINGQLRICQFGPEFCATNNALSIDSERLNPNKFTSAAERINYIKDHGGAVPKIFRSGIINELGIHRSFIEMEFLKGVPGDYFLKSNPEKATELFFKVGQIIGNLTLIPLPYAREKETLKDMLITRQSKLLKELTDRKILTLNEERAIYNLTIKRINDLPNLPRTFVHKDLFPVNWHVSGVQSQLSIHLTDIEAIDIGHPWLEGIIRAGQWAGSDWISITGNLNSSDVLIKSLLEGFNSASLTEFQIEQSMYKSLANTEELIWLPLAINYSLLSGESSEINRRKKNLLSLLEEI